MIIQCVFLTTHVQPVKIIQNAGLILLDGVEPCWINMLDTPAAVPVAVDPLEGHRRVARGSGLLPAATSLNRSADALTRLA
jgi:hypothetical protein